MYKKIGERLKKIRYAKQMSQKEFARYLNVSLRNYQKWENGKRIPDVHHLLKMANKLDVNTDWLLGITDYLITICRDEDIKKYFRDK